MSHADLFRAELTAAIRDAKAIGEQAAREAAEDGALSLESCAAALQRGDSVLAKEYAAAFKEDLVQIGHKHGDAVRIAAQQRALSLGGKVMRGLLGAVLLV